MPIAMIQDSATMGRKAVASVYQELSSFVDDRSDRDAGAGVVGRWSRRDNKPKHLEQPGAGRMSRQMRPQSQGDTR